MKEILYVGAGSALGGIGRYLAGKGLTLLYPYPFPLGTFTINILGSLVIGYVYGLASRGTTHPGLFLFLTTGFCGGFTTFSAFSMENILLMKNGQYGVALSYILGSVVLGLLACLLGYHWGK
jgi:CrcB protein